MKLIDTDRILEALGAFADEKHGDQHFLAAIASAREIIEGMPEAVTRCGDCRYNYGNVTGHEYNQYDIVCSYFDTDGMEASDYCSRGIYKKRRTNDAGRTDERP